MVLFLFILNTLLLVALITLIRTSIRSLAVPEPVPFPIRELPLLIGILTGGLALLLLFGVLEGRSVQGGATNYAPFFVFACGVFSAWSFGARVRRLGQSLRSSRTTGISVSFGVSLAALLASTYLILTALDHWRFFSGSEDGVVDLRGMGVVEVPCDIAIIHVDGDEVAYRCPTSTIFSSRYTTPFIPWPDYKSGRSRLLRKQLDAIDREASRASRGS